jgi:hypothetical protein
MQTLLYRGVKGLLDLRQQGLVRLSKAFYECPKDLNPGHNLCLSQHTVSIQACHLC